jgi:hypothetical protein
MLFVKLCDKQGLRPLLPVLFLCSAATPFPFLSMATIPTIHLNGTGFTDLRDGYAAAYDAIDKAIDALAKAELNGRDFYLQAPGAYYQARAERDQAFDQLRAAHAYVGEMLAGICDQQR